MCRFLLKESMKMKIHKVINNNIVIVLDAAEKELILMGRGIGFKKHPGDQFDERMIEKKFAMASKEQSGHLSDLLNEIPLQEMDAAVTIMETALQKLNKKLNERYHHLIAITSIPPLNAARTTSLSKMFLLWEIKSFIRRNIRLAKPHCISFRRRPESCCQRMRLVLLPCIS